MKAVILAGGMGTRISEETHIRPKPMVEIGGKPILWHIMKIYSAYGINDFIICLGYKGYVIKEYFTNYFLHMSNVTFHMQENKMEVHERKVEPWKVTLIDTGEHTKTGGRLKRIKEYIDDDTFCFTYGDGVSDININSLIEFHNQNRLLATVTATQPPARFGSVEIENYRVKRFKEKSQQNGSWINGGFFILSHSVIDDYIAGDETIWENEPMEKLARDGQLAAFKHKGFWQPMDTLRDKTQLETLWDSGNAPWKVW